MRTGHIVDIVLDDEPVAIGVIPVLGHLCRGDGLGHYDGFACCRETRLKSSRAATKKNTPTKK